MAHTAHYARGLRKPSGRPAAHGTRPFQRDAGGGGNLADGPGRPGGTLSSAWFTVSTRARWGSRLGKKHPRATVLCFAGISSRHNLQAADRPGNRIEKACNLCHNLGINFSPWIESVRAAGLLPH